jgi:hypothetical protein
MADSAGVRLQKKGGGYASVTFSDSLSRDRGAMHQQIQNRYFIHFREC